MDRKEAALKEIKALDAAYCRICATYPELKLEQGSYHANQFCLTECAIGHRITNLGGIIEYGVIRSMMTAPEFTKEAYLEAYEQGLRDWQIRERFGISANTLKRRKSAWNLIGTYNDHRSEPRSTRHAPELTKEVYLDLIGQGLEDQNVRDRYGLSRELLGKRKREWGIKHRPKYEEFSREEYHYLKGRGMMDVEIAEMWEIGKNTLLRMKRRWNAVYKPIKERYSLGDYKSLKYRGLDDKQIRSKWGISQNSLYRLKAEWSRKSK